MDSLVIEVDRFNVQIVDDIRFLQDAPLMIVAGERFSATLPYNPNFLSRKYGAFVVQIEFIKHRLEGWDSLCQEFCVYIPRDSVLANI
jgi:hypothetical protein